MKHNSFAKIFASRSLRFMILAGALISPFVSGVVNAQAPSELMTVTVEGSSKASNPVDASREIQAKVLNDVAREQVVSIIGEKRYQKNKNIVDSKIIRQAAKFAPFVNPGKVVAQSDGSYRMPVEIKMSLASLRKMILEAGLLNDAEGPASILPLIAFIDRTSNASLRWWLGEEKSPATQGLAQISRIVHENLQSELSRQGFHMIKPIGAQSSPLPEPYRVERPVGKDLDFVTDYYKTSMALNGDVRVRESKDSPGAYVVSVRLQMIQPLTGRSVAEVTRLFETDPGAFTTVSRAKFASVMPELAKDLAVQVLEAWQRGTLNTNLVRVAVRGSLNPKQLDAFKTGLLRSVKEVKDFKERSFESGQVVFEADYTGELSSLAARLRSLQIPNFDAKVAESSDKTIVLDVRSR